VIGNAALPYAGIGARYVILRAQGGRHQWHDAEARKLTCQPFRLHGGMVTKRRDQVIKSKLHRPLCGRQAILSRPVRHPNVGMDRRSHGYSVPLRLILFTVGIRSSTGEAGKGLAGWRNEDLVTQHRLPSRLARLR